MTKAGENVALLSVNGLAWGLQDISTFAAIAVSLVSFVWITLQTIRFCQKWWREEQVRGRVADAVCSLRRQTGACPGHVPPTTPGDLL